ncbi:pyridoxamine 5'-phosphate oxidase family protein [Nisaea acidiphila]|uniref:Pyridoxamine 5'-phosphate oxidase family protein n=1 Tax=Nisaea acidiphila TaxID=1862145 RepID=A0A9J7AU65_9PROT|nr:pyridoxamine 5'-phosphate oxidase family protein [Nisaea acidiphila]UUX50863.1 pyridoxamine 5'-phosphate oxidase family protein [Nisaea acidiphila]
MAKIETVEALRAIYKPAAGRAVEKELSALDPHCKRFIELSPFLLLATHNADGVVDITPRGDGPGFVAVPDGKTIVIPDRPGNNRLDSLTNILSNPTCSVIFMIPGVDETLRIRGTAEIRDDADLLAGFEVKGRLPATVLRISVDLAFLHCAKALMRSRLWNPDAQIERSTLPTLGQMIKDQLNLNVEVESQEEMVARYKEALY